MEDDEIAAAMGFSSFGGTKRKFDQTNSPKAQGGGSGANSTRLGVRPRIVASEDGAGPTSASEDVVGTDPANHTAQSETNPTPSKSKGKQRQPAAMGLAAFLTRGQSLPNKPPGLSDAPQETQNARLASEDPAATHMVSFGGTPIPRAELNTLRNGIKDANGDTAYFLPSFVEDPWEKFSKVRK